MKLLGDENIPHRFLGGGTNVLIADGELPYVVLHLPTSQPGMKVEGNAAYVDAAADLGGMVTFCAKHDLGGMEGLIRRPRQRGRRSANERRGVWHFDWPLCPRD